jgi:hypothetical protein
MADKRISQLVERTDIANNDVLPIVASGATTTNKVTVSTLQDWMQDNLDVGVTSVGLSVPSAFTVSGSPVTTSGNITISGAGTTAQYIRGDGSLADFPSSLGGGGASVSYYLNGSVSQGTIGGIAYREMNKTPIFGAGTDITISSNGYVASFITDAGDPALLEIPAGNWNFETYLSASSGGGSPTFYIELYKVNSGGTATLIASNSGTPESISLGTNINPYFSALAVPTTSLALTDRLAIRIYVTPAGRTITLHTENSHLCQIITTFTTGLTALNGLTAQVQNLATGTSGSDFNIVSSGTTHTFNIPSASSDNRGLVTTGAQNFAGNKSFQNTIFVNAGLRLDQNGTALPTFVQNISGTGLISSGSNGLGFNSGNNLYFSGSDKGGAVFSVNNSAVRTYTLQNANGTLAFTSDLGGYLPLTGGTLTGALNGTSAVFSGDVQSGTRLIAAASSQSIILTPNSGGTTNRIESVGTLPLALVSAAAITLAAGGTTPQITLATTGAVTLTGALNGTSASFTGQVNAASKYTWGSSTTGTTGQIATDGTNNYFDYIGSLIFRGAAASNTLVTFSSTGAATFSSSVTATSFSATDATGSAILTTNGGGEGILSLNTANPLRFIINGSERMRITSAGNVCINTTSSTGAINADSFRSNLVLGAANSNKIAFNNGSTTETGYVYNDPSETAIGYPSAGSFKIQRVGVGSVVTINSSGNVGIGTASPSSILHTLTSSANGGIIATSSATTLFTEYRVNTSTAVGFIGNGNGLVTGGGNGNFGIRAEDSLLFAAGGNNERMRITSSGQLLVNQTTATATTNGWMLSGSGSHYGFSISNNQAFVYNNNVTSVHYDLDFRTNNISRGFIRVNDTSVGYITSSDYRLKEDLQEIKGLEKVSALKVYDFKWKDSEDRTDGVLAHELAEVLPYAVTGEKDAVDEDGNDRMQGVDYSKIVPVLIKAIQEQQEQIDSLKNQIK